MHAPACGVLQPSTLESLRASNSASANKRAIVSLSSNRVSAHGMPSPGEGGPLQDVSMGEVIPYVMTLTYI